MIDHYGSKLVVKFNKDCLKQSNKLTYDYGHKVNVYIVGVLNVYIVLVLTLVILQ